MPTIHPNAKSEITKYIGKMPAFSQAICKKLRRIILDTNPAIKEDWKWGPNYNVEGMVCGYGAFKQYVKLTFFNGSAMKDKKKIFNHCVDNEFSRSIKYTDIDQVDEQALKEYIIDSIEVNKKGFKRAIKDKEVDVPEDLLLALRIKKKAIAFFDQLSYGYKKDFAQWVSSAKREETRKDRIAKVVSKCADGKRMNDEYK